MTTLAEHSGAVLLAFPAVKKLKSQGLFVSACECATGHVKELYVILIRKLIPQVLDVYF